MLKKLVAKDGMFKATIHWKYAELHQKNSAKW